MAISCVGKVICQSRHHVVNRPGLLHRLPSPVPHPQIRCRKGRYRGRGRAGLLEVKVAICYGSIARVVGCRAAGRALMTFPSSSHSHLRVAAWLSQHMISKCRELGKEPTYLQASSRRVTMLLLRRRLARRFTTGLAAACSRLALACSHLGSARGSKLSPDNPF